MKKFKNLTPKESIGLDLHLYKNAVQLKKDAILIADKRKSYSSATSLLILSSEEVIKSILILLHSKGYNIYKLKESTKFFFDHKIRHQIAQLIEMGLGIIETFMKYEEEKLKKPFKTKYKWLNNVLNEVSNIAISSGLFFDSTHRIKKLQGFNDLKNKGFYVDYKDALILPQTEINEVSFKETLLVTERVFKFSKVLRILFHEKIDNHISESEISEIKQSLHDFIDNGLKDFSFKELSKL